MWWHGPGMGLFGWGFMPGHGLLIALLLIFAVIAMTRRAQRRLPSAGMRSLDILEERYAKGVNPIYRSIERTSLAEWQNILDTNLTGVFLCCKYLGAIMAEQRSGSIISISSVAGHIGLARSAPYNATKGGVELLTKSLAIDWAQKGVRVNCIAPGYFETDLTAGMRENEAMTTKLLSRTPLNRFGKLNDLAGAAVFLASDASAYVTGQSLRVDGGYTAS